MIVMPGNNGGLTVGMLAGKYPGRIEWLIGPGGFRRPPDWMPYALDNGAFPAWTNGELWDEDAFVDLVRMSDALRERPQWVVVPDSVGNPKKTLQLWELWSGRLKRYKKAFAVQDGMCSSDVPSGAEVVFVGGTTKWKWENLTHWTDNFPRVHVGRVNTYRMLWMADEAGAESCDGTGWLRGGQQRVEGLFRYLEESTTGKKMQRELEGILCTG